MPKPILNEHGNPKELHSARLNFNDYLSFWGDGVISGEVFPDEAGWFTVELDQQQTRALYEAMREFYEEKPQ